MVLLSGGSGMGDAAADERRDMLLQEHCDTERRERGDSLEQTVSSLSQSFTTSLLCMGVFLNWVLGHEWLGCRSIATRSDGSGEILLSKSSCHPLKPLPAYYWALFSNRVLGHSQLLMCILAGFIDLSILGYLQYMHDYLAIQYEYLATTSGTILVGGSYICMPPHIKLSKNFISNFALNNLNRIAITTAISERLVFFHILFIYPTQIFSRKSIINRH